MKNALLLALVIVTTHSFFALAQETKETNSIRVENAILKTLQEVSVSAEAPGIIAELKVSEGDRVKQGEELGRVRDDAIRLQIAKAAIELKTAEKKKQNDIMVRLAKKASKVAESEHERALRGNREIANTYTVAEVDRRRLTWEKSLLEIEQADQDQSLLALEVEVAANQLAQSEELARRHRILAPINGMVVSVEKHQGEWAEAGIRVLQIVEVDRFRIEGFVHAADAAILRRGCDAKAVIHVSEEKSMNLAGKVVFISPEANPINGMVRTFIEIRNPGGEEGNQLRAGLRVEVTVAPPVPAPTTSP